MTTNFGGVDVVPLITQKLVFAIWGLCWYNFCVFFCACIIFAFFFFCLLFCLLFSSGVVRFAFLGSLQIAFFLHFIQMKKSLELA